MMIIMTITIMVLKKMDHIMVTCSEFMNGNAYTKGDNYYYSEYGKNNYRNKYCVV